MMRIAVGGAGCGVQWRRDTRKVTRTKPRSSFCDV